MYYITILKFIYINYLIIFPLYINQNLFSTNMDVNFKQENQNQNVNNGSSLNSKEKFINVIFYL